ncbi:hypothetical protein M3Y99_01417900 [Aphelenchoides fujianensis]|nr:hypothetical protein M3Y99_01417900 [Aphelenchoides fujianensis]
MDGMHGMAAHSNATTLRPSTARIRLTTTTAMPMDMHGHEAAEGMEGHGMSEMEGMAGMEGHQSTAMETFSTIDLWQYGFAIVVSVFILLAYSFHFYKWWRNPSMRVSIAILINMAAWMVTEAWCIVYSINSIVTYGQSDLPPLPIFWFGTLYFAGIIAVSLSVFLLMVDRCSVLLFPMVVSTGVWRSVLTGVLVALEYAVFILVLYLKEFPVKAVAQCSVIDCVAAEHAETLNATKIGYGLLNTAMALFFGFLLVRYNTARRVKQSNTRRANFVVLLTVVLQLGFNFIPSLVNFISHKMSKYFPLFTQSISLQTSHNHDMTSNTAGPQVSTLAQLDGLLTALLYSSMFVKQKKKTEPFVTRSTFQTQA